MAEWVVDRAGTKLVSQINAIAPNRRKDSDGTIGDPAHQARESAHNPEDSSDADAPGNPDNQVDARDITHDPANGCDIGVFWEQIRTSRDMRARHAIFNRRQFSNRVVGGVPAFTWRDYTGSNPHDKHGHIEIDDRYHDQVHDWQIGADDMPLSPAEGYTLHHVNYVTAGLAAMTDVIVVPKYTNAGQTWAARSIPNVQAVTIKAIGNPDVDEVKLAQELAAILGPLLEDALEPAGGLTTEEATAIVEDALNRAKIVVTPKA